MSISRDLPGAQLGIATGGTSLFLLLVTVTGGLQTESWAAIQGLARGYTLALVCAFAVLVLWTLSRQAGLRAVGERPVLLWLGYFPAGIALVAGGVWLLADLFSGPGLAYHLGWILAVIVFAGGLMPLGRHVMPSS
jgi:hypothetical protein